MFSCGMTKSRCPAFTCALITSTCTHVQHGRRGFLIADNGPDADAVKHVPFRPSSGSGLSLTGAGEHSVHFPLLCCLNEIVRD